MDEQISFNLDSLKFAKYLDESKESINQFYFDFGDKKQITLALSDDSCFCNDTLKTVVKKNYEPYGWIVGGAVSASLLNVIGAAAIFIGHEKAAYRTNDSLQVLEERCSKQLVEAEKSKIRFRYASYGIVAGLIINTVFIYYQIKE